MLPPTKTVCIVGAGPSGLVAAKTLAHNHPRGTFRVTIFEQSERIGGLWPICKKETQRLNPLMRTNQSKNTVCFSDLAWSADTPQFPTALDVGNYLIKYLQKYPCEDLRLSTKVTHTILETDGTWKVYVDELFPQGTSSIGFSFDYLLLGNGFFSNPRTPNILRIPAVIEKLNGRAAHSYHFKDVNQLLTNGGQVQPSTGRKIYVVGGQMSGIEVAASVAFQLSSAVNSPGISSIMNASEYSVHHIIQRPPWIMPLFFPQYPTYKENSKDGNEVKKHNPAPTFLPLDLVTYNLSWRPEGPITNTSGSISEKLASRPHDFMSTWLGSNQNDLGEKDLIITDERRSQPAYLTVSDTYTEFVRSGLIKVSKGKIKDDDVSGPDVIVENEDGQKALDDIAGIIFATGFEATSTISFLDESVLSRLQHDKNCVDIPVALNLHSTINREIPSLGFVGFYRSPFWGVMELQARFLGQLWSGDEAATKALCEDETLNEMLSLRHDPRRAQNPMGDYVYLMESFSKILGITRLDTNGVPDLAAPRTGIVVPYRYPPVNASEIQQAEVAKGIQTVNDVFRSSANEGRYVARAIFRALQGDWKLERIIHSELPSHPSGRLSGTAKFLPRYPTDEEFDLEYLFLEEGRFRAESGFEFPAKRSYVYRYRDSTDTLSAWFAKADLSVDYLFHDLQLVIPPSGIPTAENLSAETHAPKAWIAKASHLCIKDLYNVKYRFWFRGVQLKEWSVRFNVKGPGKDYAIVNTFKRGPKEAT